MSRALEDATARAWVVLATMLGATLAILLPSQLTTASHAAGSVTLAVITLAFAALVRFGVRSVAFAARTKTAVPPTDDKAAPVLAGRVTDPVHHPLRPRAPGLP